ncbi:helix-turn-helix transcriptional regulator [Mammaliicoccus sciuri]|uniref:helix-turn-helix transcriptional regulator n=1 Tax=Mammaliicoccus sciuri TaxID=1296 RepID=UPI00194F61CD|nr:helix-turn-helix transcriptional regulator [Mammaliicoccus sciuri]
MSVEIKQLYLKSLLVDKGYSVKRFSEIVPMDYVYLINIINGKASPSVTMAIKISKAIGVEVEELFTFKDKEETTCSNS